MHRGPLKELIQMDCTFFDWGNAKLQIDYNNLRISSIV